MKSRVALMLTVAISAFAVSPCFTSAQSPQDKQDKGDSILLRASEVLLDVVVRDKKGRIVKDLKQTDFEIYEDNVKQDISSFRLVSRESVATAEARETKKDGLNAAPAASATTGGREPFSGINLIAMVFDHLSPNARNLAHKAAMSFVDESLQPDDL
ncbi:MAG TPA: hypothetical protein VNO14_06550, partial [Blastocatellia bacterium]|nr:hypothetical protein [Blastocatellia bacterium]